MNAMDYLRVELNGWTTLKQEKIVLNRAIGYSSVHFGDFLPNYAAIANVPPVDADKSGILLNVTDSDDIRHWASLRGGERGTFGVHVAKIVAEFKLDVEGRLAEILPAKADTDSGDDDRHPARHARRE
jgi:hypothetical protein